MATSEINAENSIIEDLRCFICNRYLVYGPIQVTPDGNTMCGQCSSGNTDAHRVFVIEKILRKLSFPCKNKKYGCLSTCNFDMAENHENTCKFQPFLCPFFKKWTCAFQGTLNNFIPHLNACHKDLIRMDLNFSFDLNYDKEEEFVASSEGKVFFVQYFYNSKTFDLTLSTAQFAYKSEETKLQISNDLNGDRTMILKAGLCISYANIATKNEFVINMQPFEAVLDTKLIFCTLIFESKEQPKKKPKAVATTSEPQKVVEKVDDKVDDQCKWKGCKFTSAGKNKKEHERTCNFRVYRCIAQSCNKHFKSDGGEAHLQKHNIMFHQRFTGINFLTPDGQEYKMCAFVNKEFVLISYTMFNCKGKHTNPMITLKANSSGYKGGAAFTFSHTHCKNQSKSFYIKWNNVLNVSPDDLPPCFYTEQFISFSLIVNAN